MDIPEDILATAEKLLVELSDPFSRVETVAEAIKAERERCAKIAETWESPTRPGSETSDRQFIAAAIRSVPDSLEEI